MEIRERIIEIMNDVCNTPISENTEEDLLESGVLDSLSVMQLVGELNDAFNIDLDVDDVLPENFDTIGHIAALVERCQK